jgi:hypothetical protein
MSTTHPEARELAARPLLAVGHLDLHVQDAIRTREFLVQLGARSMGVRENMAILELRGGTHIVVTPSQPGAQESVSPAFDLMVDDIDAARQRCIELGVRPSSVRSDLVHSSFHITEPSGRLRTIVSSHAGKRPI